MCPKLEENISYIHLSLCVLVPFGCSWHKNLGLKCGGSSEISFNIIRSIQHFRNAIEYKDFKRILLACLVGASQDTNGREVSVSSDICWWKSTWDVPLLCQTGLRCKKEFQGESSALCVCVWESSKIFTLEAKACSSCELTKDCHLAECSWEKWDPRKELCFDY